MTLDHHITPRRRQRRPGDYVKAWQPVVARGTRIVALGDNPEVTDDTLACLTRVGDDRSAECGVPRAPAFAQRDPIVGAARQVPSATLIDLTQYYCIDEWCPAVIGDVIVHSDTNHLTNTYIRMLRRSLTAYGWHSTALCRNRHGQFDPHDVG